MTPAEALEYLDSMARMENVTGSAVKAQGMAHAVAVVRATVEAREDADKLVAQRVADALMMRDRAAAYDAKITFFAARIAWHLAHGCDTAQRARELALAEWDAGVLGVTR